MFKMGIRKASADDWKEISELLEQLGYPVSETLIKAKIDQFMSLPDEEFLVYEEKGKVVGVVSMHFIPQIVCEGDFARISYLAVDQEFRSRGIGRAIEEHCVEIARRRKCDRIELHCHSRRIDAHRFYARQGYIESPKYFFKTVNL
jgi:N-acetylglutamate synthase-like GNAT family acetyltransferase